MGFFAWCGFLPKGNKTSIWDESSLSECPDDEKGAVARMAHGLLGRSSSYRGQING
jgi:hypothetical protein